MFTKSPGFALPNPVTLNVSGMRQTQNSDSLTQPTVRLHPLRPIKPWGKTCFLCASGKSNQMFVLPSCVSIRLIAKAMDTCPEIIWPPISSPYFNERSTFTQAPCSSRPRLVSFRVWPITSKLKWLSLCAVTVRQVPLMAMLAPISTLWLIAFGRVITKLRWLLPVVIELIWPWPWTIPVNMIYPKVIKKAAIKALYSYVIRAQRLCEVEFNL